MTDLISRSHILNIIEMWMKVPSYSEAELNIMRAFDYEVRTAPSVEPKWIPVTPETMPEELTPVNITYINTKPPTYYDFIRGVPMVATAVYYKGIWFWWSTYCEDVLWEYGNDESDKMDDRIKVIAWMPLPEPYREVSE